MAARHRTSVTASVNVPRPLPPAGRARSIGRAPPGIDGAVRLLVCREIMLRRRGGLLAISAIALACGDPFRAREAGPLADGGSCDGELGCDAEPPSACELAAPEPPPIPSLRAPAEGARTGSPLAPAAARTLRPTFAWSSPPGPPGPCVVTYDLQLDDACDPAELPCAFASPTIEATGIDGASWTPDAPLPIATVPPVGRRYAWRVRACDDAARCSAWSAPRWVHVGRLRDDWNGDGLSDVAALGADGAGEIRDVHVLAGAAPLVAPLASAAATLPAPTSSLVTPTWCDVDADGFADVVVPSSSASGELAAVYVVRGRASGDGVADALVSLEAPLAGGSARCVGDLDADGFDDVALAATGGLAPTLTLVRGAAAAPREQVALAPPAGGPAPLASVAVAAGAPDLDGDGVPDLVLLASDHVDPSAAGVTELWAAHGGAPPGALARTLALDGVPMAVASAGDVDADGRGDLVFAALGAEASLDLVLGDAKLGSAVASSWSDGLPLLGARLTGGRDLDGDAVPDLIAIGGPLDSATAPADRHVLLFHGAATLGAPVLDLAPAPDGTKRPAAIAIADDLDGDGHADLVVGWASATGGEVQLRSGPLHAGAAPTLRVPAPAGTLFGVAVAQ